MKSNGLFFGCVIFFVQFLITSSDGTFEEAFNKSKNLLENNGQSWTAVMQQLLEKNIASMGKDMASSYMNIYRQGFEIQEYINKEKKGKILQQCLMKQDDWEKTANEINDMQKCEQVALALQVYKVEKDGVEAIRQISIGYAAVLENCVKNSRKNVAKLETCVKSSINYGTAFIKKEFSRIEENGEKIRRDLLECLKVESDKVIVAGKEYLKQLKLCVN